MPDEQLLVLDPLVLPDTDDLDPLASPAAALFLDRAAASGATWERTDDMVAAVTELCRRVDGLPLAIELAASRARAISPVELLALLDERLDVLRTREAGRPERHRSVRAAIDVSVDLLDEPGRSFFHRLGALAGHLRPRSRSCRRGSRCRRPAAHGGSRHRAHRSIPRGRRGDGGRGRATAFWSSSATTREMPFGPRGVWNEANERLTEVLASEADAHPA